MNSASTPATSTILDSVMITEEPTDQSYDLFSLAGQPKDPFAPMSWVDYGDNSMNMFGESSFGGNAYMNDFSSSFNLDVPMSWNDLTGSGRTGLTPAVQKNNPMESKVTSDPMLEDIRAQIAADPKKLVPCHKIWYVTHFTHDFQHLTMIRDKIQDRQDFKDGTLDIDGLCNELRQKAKCSENGVVIDQKDIDAALHRLPPTTKSPTAS
jgi:AP-1-like factor